MSIKGAVLREWRDTPPAHYLIKLQSFSLYSKHGVHHIMTNIFQAGQQEWKIILYPKGKDGGKGDHVSIYIMLESTSSLEAGKDVNAIFKFFLFDQIRGKYLTVQGRAKRFDWVKYEWGFSKFISLEALEEPTNGFLVDDTCFFGVEVFLSEGPRLGQIDECLSISEAANISGKYVWEVYQFSELEEDCYSDEFRIGGHLWYVRKLFDHQINSIRPLPVFGITIITEFYTSINVENIVATIWFSASIEDWGWHSLIELKDLNDSAKGYVVDDRCIFEAELTLLCETSLETPNMPTDSTSLDSSTSSGSSY
ncbi:ubiquitin C-terminal hydrolase 12-like [Apium graveolens]|uniref:ubiquitin C-terminal hydrolase 12-like n=1 Tax=Apium graveolens TaxID=4045 RepID=UPI003D7A1E01